MRTGRQTTDRSTGAGVKSLKLDDPATGGPAIFLRYQRYKPLIGDTLPESVLGGALVLFTVGRY